MANTCNECGRGLTVYADDLHTAIRIEGEAECCCGDFDSDREDANYVDATCVDCCAKYHAGRQVWEGKSAGGGYYIVNPSF